MMVLVIFYGDVVLGVFGGLDVVFILGNVFVIVVCIEGCILF